MPNEFVARIVGKRKGVHRLIGDPELTGACHAGLSARDFLTAEQLAVIVSESPRRLCGHCYRTRD